MAQNLEFIITLRCKECGDITSLKVPLNFEEAIALVDEFKEKHLHDAPGPWII